jgi:hypothetical protein
MRKRGSRGGALAARSRRFFIWLISTLSLWAPLSGRTTAAPANEGLFSYADWNAVLEAHVDERGMVDYAALARAPEALDRFLAQVERTSPDADPSLFPSRNDQLAYYLNAYNAWVFRGVLARGPEKESVWRGGLVSGYAFFVGAPIVLGGVKTNLKKLEDAIVRGRFADPRIHAALNCASRGCPRLPRRAFKPATLDAELDAAMREFVSEERNVAVDPAGRSVTLSKIFDWFESDFLAFEKARGTRDPRLVDYVNRYRAPGAGLDRDARVRFAPYDKRVNAR